MQEDRSLGKGVVAGLVGGLVASWIMNEFMADLGQKIQKAVQSDEQNEQQQQQSSEPKEDATMKAADAIVATATGSEHRTWEEKRKGGPVVHYSFGALMGGIYGGIAEYFRPARSGFGTTFGSTLFTAVDLIAVPVFNFAPSPGDQPISSLASPFATHVVYGFTTELVRRLVRFAL